MGTNAIVSTAELKLAGIALKGPKLLRKHNKVKQGHKVRNSEVSLLQFLTPKQRSLKSPYGHT